MPVYHIKDLMKKRGKANPAIINQSVVGEYMKAAIVTKPEAEGPPLHMHPNEEQFTLVLEGKLHIILGDEDLIVEPGDLVHIPRFTPHRTRPVDGPAVFYAVKSPAGKTGEMDEDYNKVEGAEKAEEKYPGKKKKK
jgi:mannose-6-phosphate isomerase-like protein (cupin superfamily)